MNDNENLNINCAILVLNVSTVGYIAPNEYDLLPVVLPLNVSIENKANFLKSNVTYNDWECNNDCISLSNRTSGTMQCKQQSTYSGE